MAIKTTQQRQHLTTVAGVEGTWAQVAGGKGNADTSESWDGGATNPDILNGPRKYTDLTLTRPFKRERDAAIVKRLDSQIGQEFTARRVYLDENLVATADDNTWIGVLKAVNDPDSDSASAERSEMSIVLGVSSRS